MVRALECRSLPFHLKLLDSSYKVPVMLGLTSQHLSTTVRQLHSQYVTVGIAFHVHVHVHVSVCGASVYVYYGMV